jgi:hypothetical protein
MAVTFRQWAIIISCVPIFVLAQQPGGMTLTTPEGTKIVLNKDNTWTSIDGKRPEIAESYTVPLNDGRFVLVGDDHTWGFVEKALVHVEDEIKIDSITGQGHCLNRVYAVAAETAQKQALQMSIDRAKLAFKNKKFNPVKLTDCVRRVEKDIDKTENFKDGVGWDVTVRIKLDRGSILAVYDCAGKVEEDTTAGF